MVGLFATPLRRGLVLALALFLGACGMEPAQPSTNSSPGGDSSQTSSSALIKLAQEENRLKADPLCFEADEEYRPIITDILGRHNKAVMEMSNLSSQDFLKAGYPDYQEGVSLRVCDDPGVYAYSYSKTVVLHSGLLDTLKKAAGEDTLFASSVAFVIYHELGHIQMGHANRTTNLKNINEITSDPLPEIEADAFAATILQRAGYSLKGVDLLFSVLNRINPQGALAHPPSWERLNRVRQLTGNKETG